MDLSNYSLYGIMPRAKNVMRCCGAMRYGKRLRIYTYDRADSK